MNDSLSGNDLIIPPGLPLKKGRTNNSPFYKCDREGLFQPINTQRILCRHFSHFFKRNLLDLCHLLRGISNITRLVPLSSERDGS